MEQQYKILFRPCSSKLRFNFLRSTSSTIPGATSWSELVWVRYCLCLFSVFWVLDPDVAQKVICVAVWVTR
jgi:hypothetical protein